MKELMFTLSLLAFLGCAAGSLGIEAMEKGLNDSIAAYENCALDYAVSAAKGKEDPDAIYVASKAACQNEDEKTESLWIDYKQRTAPSSLNVYGRPMERAERKAKEEWEKEKVKIGRNVVKTVVDERLKREAHQ